MLFEYSCRPFLCLCNTRSFFPVKAAASEVVQATVAAHISAICAGALRFRDEIVATTTRPTPAAIPETEGVTPEPILAESVFSATTAATGGRGDCIEAPAGEALERRGFEGGPAAVICSRGGGGGGGGEIGGFAGSACHLRYEKKYEAHDQVRAAHEKDTERLKEGRREGDGGAEETEETDSPSPAADTVPSSTSTAAPTAPAATSPTAADDDDDGDDDNGQWWEEDEEDDEEELVCEQGVQSDGTAGINKLWRGTTARSKTSNNGGGAGGETSTSRWIRRREREIPFLGLLVRSQVI